VENRSAKRENRNAKRDPDSYREKIKDRMLFNLSQFPIFDFRASIFDLKISPTYPKSSTARKNSTPTYDKVKTRLKGDYYGD